MTNIFVDELILIIIVRMSVSEVLMRTFIREAVLLRLIPCYWYILKLIKVSANKIN